MAGEPYAIAAIMTEMTAAHRRAWEQFLRVVIEARARAQVRRGR